jgi:hypothetical protein
VVSSRSLQFRFDFHVLKIAVIFDVVQTVSEHYFNCCLSVHVDNYTIIVPTKCTSFY